MTPEDARQAAADLRAAKALIDAPEKWTKGKLRDDAGRRCIMGALCATVAPMTHRWAAALALLDEKTSFPRSIMCWNDAPERTHADVMHAFDRAIAAADAALTTDPSHPPHTSKDPQ